MSGRILDQVAQFAAPVAARQTPESVRLAAVLVAKDYAPSDILAMLAAAEAIARYINDGPAP